MKQWTVTLSGLLGSYGVSILAFIQNMNVIGAATSLAGMMLTLSIAYENYQKASLNKEEARSKRIANDLKEIELKKSKNEHGTSQH